MGQKLADVQGNSLQSKIENGGNNQRAQLLVPADKLFQQTIEHGLDSLT